MGYKSPLIFGLIFANLGCAGINRTANTEVHGNTAAPSWVYRNSINSDKICAVGSCGLTFNLEDAKPCAADNARESLAKSVSIEVKSVMLDTNDNGSQYVDSAGISFVNGYTSETVLNEAVIEEYFYDSEGRVTKGNTYALACIPKSKVSGQK